MRLKSISLSGFKSFVDPTKVTLPSNMCAVVGPNGCGKSNIIDAVRWVMGESSAKTLRGESMTDVIFNGTTHRQPVGQASIELLFDNSTGKVGGEYAAYNEISVRRLVTREGTSGAQGVELSTSPRMLLVYAVTCRMNEHAIVSPLLRASNVAPYRDLGRCPCVRAEGRPVMCSMLCAATMMANESARRAIANRSAQQWTRVDLGP